jgi:hypothetical protein
LGTISPAGFVRRGQRSSFAPKALVMPAYIKGVEVLARWSLVHFRYTGTM